MNQLNSIRRVALAATLAGAAIGAVPAMASAATTSCTYDPATKTATVFDGSGAGRLRLSVFNGFINVNPNQLCVGPKFEFAALTNTDRIVVNAVVDNPQDIMLIDESGGEFGPGATRESDGNSEIEIFVNSSTAIPEIEVVGTSGPDVMQAGGHGRIGIGPDDDVDITAIQAARFALTGFGGNDFLSGRGFGALVPSAVRVSANGGPGADTLVDSPLFNDGLDGGSDDDTIFALDGNRDFVVGGTGSDTATLDPADDVRLNDVELRTIETVGRVKLASKRVHARAGELSIAR